MRRWFIILLVLAAAPALAQPGRDALERNQEFLRQAEEQAARDREFVQQQQTEWQENFDRLRSASSRKELEARVAALEREVADLRHDIRMLIEYYERRLYPALE